MASSATPRRVGGIGSGVMDFFFRETYRKHTENPNVSSIENGWEWLVLVNVPWCSMTFHDVPCCSMMFHVLPSILGRRGSNRIFDTVPNGSRGCIQPIQPVIIWEPGSTWEPGPRMMWSFSSQMVFSLACERRTWNMASGGLQTASEISCLIVIKSG